MCGPGVDDRDLLLHGFLPPNLKSVLITRVDGSGEKVGTPGGFVHYRFAKASSPIATISWTSADGSAVRAPSPFPVDASLPCKS
jgi:hypothetical protein